MCKWLSYDKKARYMPYAQNLTKTSINQSFILTRYVKELKKLVQNTDVYKLKSIIITAMLQYYSILKTTQ